MENKKKYNNEVSEMPKSLKEINQWIEQDYLIIKPQKADLIIRDLLARCCLAEDYISDRLHHVGMIAQNRLEAEHVLKFIREGENNNNPARRMYSEEEVRNVAFTLYQNITGQESVPECEIDKSFEGLNSPPLKGECEESYDDVSDPMDLELANQDAKELARISVAQDSINKHLSQVIKGIRSLTKDLEAKIRSCKK